MEIFLEHLAKSTAIGLLFLTSYVLFLRKETYFKSNRMYLLLGVLSAAILPFVQFTKTVFVDPEPIAIGDYTVIQNTQVATNDIVNWQAVVLAIYNIGVAILSIRFLVQLWRIKTIKKKGDVLLDDDIKHIRTKNRLSPFSFFKNIFYCPTQFDSEELNAIIMHEKAHAKQHHSLDVLFIQLVCIIFWFNPLAWFFKHFIKQNLEYLADAAALEQVSDKKQYQYLMLRQAIGTEKMAITNPFNNSLTKKRITMLHQNQSKKMNLFKLLIILPFLGLFLVAFNTKTEYKVKPNAETAIVKTDRSFDYVIEKNTSNEQLEHIKMELLRNNVDFSYTSVRNSKGEIIDLQLNAVGFDVGGQYFNLDYASDIGKPIKDVLIYHNQKKKEFFIGEKDTKEQNLNSKKRSAAPIQSGGSNTPKKSMDFSARITNITIEVDKNSTDENLKKDSKFVEDNHNIKIDFKGIKRNSAGEITAIKVVYDNGSGDKGNYQQKKSEGISPFKIAMTFNDDGLATIDILGQDELHTHKNKTMVWVSDDGGEGEVIEIKKHGPHKNVWVSENGGQHETIEIKTDGDNEMIFLNGKKVTKEELENGNKAEKLFIKLHNDSKKDSVIHIIKEVRVNDENGEQIIKIKDKTKNSPWKVNYGVSTIEIIEEDSIDLDQNFKKIKIVSDVDIDEEEDNVFILDLDESGDHKKKVSIISDGKEPLIIIDGKESTYEALKKLSPDDIKTMDVSKGEAAQKKYGDKAQNGVIEVTTKTGN